MAPVQLYVYDLSNGMARNMSLQLTGRQIDGIWHTSVVVFGKEIFYGGTGIQTTAPGLSHHGRPLKVENMGETALGEETFNDYILEMQSEYAGYKYHLLDFNCNSFTNDCVGFLTGRSIPPWIKDLPADFLSTPFGQAMRPMIDNMFQRPGAAGHTHTSAPAPPISQAVASSMTSHVQMATNPATFESILSSNKAVVAFFTSDTCPPCRMIEPKFKDLAEEKGGEGVAFVEISMNVGMSGAIARAYSISATPSFLFFIDGQKTSELKGANAAELKSQVDLMLYEAFPPHPHERLDLPSIRTISTEPILYQQVPAYDALWKKLDSFIDTSSIEGKDTCKRVLNGEILSYFKRRFPAPPAKPSLEQSSGPREALLGITRRLFGVLPDSEAFPVVDLWRLAVQDEAIASWLALALANPTEQSSAFDLILNHVHHIQRVHPEDLPRNLLLTTLRLCTNAFCHPTLARCILGSNARLGEDISPRSRLTSILISSLLHDDLSTRTAAATLLFNISAFRHRQVLALHRRKPQDATSIDDVLDGEWEVELLSALVEALGREETNDEIVIRLLASLALLTYLSPNFQDEMVPLLGVLQVEPILVTKANQLRNDKKNLKRTHELISMYEQSSA